MSAMSRLSWVFCFIIIFFLISSLAVRNSDRKTRSLVLRLQIVVFIESFLTSGSCYIWHNISQLGLGLYSHSRTDDTADDEVSATVEKKHSSSSNRPLPGPRNGLIRIRFQLLWKLILFVILFSAQLCYPLGVTYVSVEPYPFVLFSYICMGLHILLMTNITLWIFMSKIIQKLFCRKSSKNFRRVWMLHLKVFVVVVVTVLMSFSAISRAFNGPVIKKVNVPINNLSKSFDGLRIVQLSDVHLGPTVGKSQLKNAIEIANSLNPDLVSITGDLVDSSVTLLSEAALPLTKLAPKYGTYFVTGNHEYYTGDVDSWTEYLSTLGVRFLHNDNIKIINQNEKEDFFYLAGTDDEQGEKFRYGDHGFKLEKALDGTDSKHPVILLAHRPAAAYSALSTDQRVKLVLSGHTHGGQFFPMIVGAYLFNPYFTGLYQYSSTSYVYVSSGTFYWGIPMRLFSTPEVTLITLQAA